MTPGVDIREGNVLDRLRELPDESVHCVVTSPPYWVLRLYSWGGDGSHPKADEHEWEKNEFPEDRTCPCGARAASLGMEKTPEEYVAEMVEVFREVRRVLRDDGTLWLNLGDSFASGKGTCHNPGGGADSLGQGRKAEGVHPLDRGSVMSLRQSGLKPKDLIGIPWRVAFALQADGWWLRSDNIWSKPNPMPESVTDRPTKAHEYVFLLTKAARYYYDADAVREACNPNSISRYAYEFGKGRAAEVAKSPAVGNGSGHTTSPNPGGHNLRSVWTIATAPYPAAHFATFPPKLVEPCIRAGTSEHGVCPECGAPWVRQMEVTGGTYAARKAAGVGGPYNMKPEEQQTCGTSKSITTGWLPSCECGKDIYRDPIPATVLDPFAGSGTVGQVCIQERRSFIGIELNPEYCRLAEKRLRGVQVRAF